MQVHAREGRAIAVMLSTLVLYTAVVLATGKVDLVPFAYLLATYLSYAFVLTAVGVLGFLAALLANEMFFNKTGENRSLFGLIKIWLIERWQRDRFFSFIWPPVLFALLMTSFNSFKQLVLSTAPFKYDEVFAQWDKALFLGTDPWIITHSILSEPWMTRAIDVSYHAWFMPMSVGVIACAFLPSSTFRLRTQYLLTYIGVWIGLGSVLAYLLPSAGPCFYNDFVGQHESFGQLMSRLNVAAEAYEGTKLGFHFAQDYLRNAFGGTELIRGGGISAMPSVHNGLAVLFAIAAFKVNRWAGWLMAAYAVVIWIGSIHLGWHYALDGIVAAIATIGLWHGAGRLVDLIDREPQQAAKAAIA
jgi:hypothetical protein